MPSHVHGGFPPLFTLALTVVALVYSRGWYRLQKGFPKALPGWRVVAFMGGLISTWAAAGSPVATLDHHMLTAHMAQHLLLMTVAAPLILLGAPSITLLHGLPQKVVRRVLRPLARSRSVRTGHAVGGLARSGTRELSRCWPSILVAGNPTLAEHRGVAAVEHSPV